MKIEFEFMDVVRIKALVEREIQRDKDLLDRCRNNLHRNIDEDLQEENKKNIELLKEEISALEEILEKLDLN